MSDDPVDSDKQNPLVRKPHPPTAPIPVKEIREAVQQQKEEDMSIAIYNELAGKLGHDPLDRTDTSWDEYHLASQYLDEKMEALRELSR